MNPVPFILLAITLPLLLGGCGEKEVSLEWRKGIVYLKGSDTPYTGKVSRFHHENGQKSWESNYKDGKEHGLQVWWYKNGQKEIEANRKDGKYDGLEVRWHENGQKFKELYWKDDIVVPGTPKYWDSKGEPVKREDLRIRNSNRLPS
jgi:antitoxin component YwqK of YwqJK toxin-antitoxin module